MRAMLPWLLTALALGMLLASVQWRLGDTSSAVGKNADAIRYVCSTTGVLNTLVVNARDQLDNSFRNGTYAKLLKSGIITRANIAAAHKTRAAYQAAHVRLVNDVPCETVAQGS